MGAWLPLVVTLPFVALLLLSGAWANRRYARFDEIPGHYDFRGDPTRMSPRGMMVWLMPAVFSFALIVINAASVLSPPEIRKGSPILNALFMGVLLLGAQALLLWLTERWARQQD